MLRNAFTDHARIRAKERYGLDLTDADLCEIVDACLGGKAVIQRAKAGCTVYIFDRAGTRMVPLIDPERRLLITFLPDDAVTAGSRLRHQRRQGNIKQKFASGCDVGGRVYRREKVSCRDAGAEE